MAEATPAVSVIIPSYKTTRYIADAIDSVLKQTFRDFEIIVVSDGCPDSAALEEVLRRYGDSVRYIWQPNQGTGIARNTAILAARGTYVLQLDADDMLTPNCLESQVRFMREHPEYDAAYCNSYNFAENSEAAERWRGFDGKLYMELYPSSGPVTFCSIMESRTPPRVLGSILRRDTVMRAGMHDDTERFAEDLDLWLRILKADPPGRIGYTEEPLGHYRLRHDNYTLDLGYPNRLLAVFEKARRTFKLTDEEKGCLDKRIAKNRFDVEMFSGKRAVHEQRWKDAIRHYEYCYSYTREFKYWAALAALKLCPWALPPGLRMLGRYGRAGN